MSDFRCGSSGSVLKLSVLSLLFLFVISPPSSGKNNPQKKLINKNSVHKSSAHKGSVHKSSIAKKSSKKVPSEKRNTIKGYSGKGSVRKDLPAKAASRKITVVMENYPPNCCIESAPRVIPASDFKHSVLKRISDKSDKNFIQSFYQYDPESGKYRLKKNTDAAALEKIKDILFSIDFLKAEGFEVEITREVFSQMGLQPVYREYPWSRCIEIMRSGNSDAILTIFKNSDRMKYLYYPAEPTLMETNALFKLKHSGISYDGDLKKLKKYVIGAKSNTCYGEKFDTAKYLKKEEVAYTQAVIKLVENKRVDLGIGPLPLLSYLMKSKKQTGKFSILRPYISREPLFIAFSKVRVQKKLPEEFSAKLTQFKKTGKYKLILKKYGIANS